MREETAARPASSAGASAAEQAARLRCEGDAKYRQAAQWEKGAAGEMATAGLLASLAGQGYRVLHDLALPGSKANVDHVVVGPTGVFVVDSKQYSGKISVGRETLWHNTRPLTDTLATLRWEAVQVIEHASIAGWCARAEPVMCVHGAILSPSRFVIAGVTVVQGAEVTGVVTAGANVLSPQMVTDVADLIERALPPRVGPSAPSGTSFRPEPRSTPRPKVPNRSMPAPPVRRTMKPDLVRLAFLGVAVLLAPIVIPAAMKFVANAGTPRAELPSSGLPSPTPTPAGAPTAAPSAVTELGGQFSCPTRGRGWSFEAQFKATQIQDAEWSSTPTGPWSGLRTAVAAGVGVTAPIEGLAGHQQVVVRVGSSANRSTWAIETQKAPATGC